MHPSTALGEKPEWVLYHEFVMTNKNYIRTSRFFLDNDTWGLVHHFLCNSQSNGFCRTLGCRALALCRE